MIIGIITRSMKSNEGHEINAMYNDIEKCIIKNNAIPIGITLTENYEYLINLCYGIIFQGGDDIESYDLEVLKYLYENNIPTLAICLGMQEMGLLFNGNLIDIDNHKSKSNYVHDVYIDKNSKLYKIYNTDKLKVNSRHKSVLKNTDLYISAVSHEGYIEAIEAKNKTFFVGVQWHPESMVNYDSIQNKLFEYFIGSIGKN